MDISNASDAQLDPNVSVEDGSLPVKTKKYQKKSFFQKHKIPLIALIVVAILSIVIAVGVGVSLALKDNNDDDSSDDGPNANTETIIQCNSCSDNCMDRLTFSCLSITQQQCQSYDISQYVWCNGDSRATIPANPTTSTSTPSTPTSATFTSSTSSPSSDMTTSSSTTLNTMTSSISLSTSTTTVSSTSTAMTSASTTVDASPNPTNDAACGACNWCLLINVNACYDWTEEVCLRYINDGYVYCGYEEDSSATTVTTTSATTTTTTTTTGTTISAPTTSVALPTPVEGVSKVSSYISKATFDDMFSLRHTAPSCTGTDKFTYENFLEACDYYPEFGSSGSDTENKIEISAFLGQISQETTGWWAGQEYKWGLCYIQELGCESGTCTGYSVAHNTYPPVAGQTYQGRGAIQISYNYNYGALSEILYGDKQVLLDDPGRLATDGVLAFRGSLWFWMTSQSPKPSCHSVMLLDSVNAPECADEGRLNGYGTTTNIINGGLECGPGSESKHLEGEKVFNRIAYYKRYCGILGVSPGSNLECTTMTPYNVGTSCANPP